MGECCCNVKYVRAVVVAITGKDVGGTRARGLTGAVKLSDIQFYEAYNLNECR